MARRAFIRSTMLLTGISIQNWCSSKTKDLSFAAALKCQIDTWESSVMIVRERQSCLLVDFRCSLLTILQNLLNLRRIGVGS